MRIFHDILLIKFDSGLKVNNCLFSSKSLTNDNWVLICLDVYLNHFYRVLLRFYVLTTHKAMKKTITRKHKVADSEDFNTDKPQNQTLPRYNSTSEHREGSELPAIENLNQQDGIKTAKRRQKQ
ncbi:hypothetical protein CS542_02840 [Pedobacter sp. IW39]|nr:hypothetical protein CS542_02840 [Pedobacter sp. IW39]